MIIADDHTIFREGIRHILDVEDDLLVVGEAGSDQAAVKLAAETQPDVVLLDAEISKSNALDTIRQIKDVSPQSDVIILGVNGDGRLIRQLLGLGARGYLLKSVSREELVVAVRSSQADQERVMLSVPRESVIHEEAPSEEILSLREREVLELVAQAMSNAQIAASLFVTEATVKRHLHNAFRKLGAVSRIDAVNKAGLVPPPRPARPRPPTG